MWGSSQLRSVIEWKNPSPEAIFEKWSENGDEIKNASKLIVGPGQGCIFVYEGKLQAVHSQAGMTELRTANIPFWTTLTKFMQAFQSEHKVGLYFFKTTQLLDIKWGTTSIVKYEDPKYKFPVGLRAFGNFSAQLKNPDWFMTNVLSTREVYTTGELRDLMSSRILQPMAQYLAESKWTYTEIDGKRQKMATDLLEVSKADFEKLGFLLLDFRVEGTSFDEETMKRINLIADTSAEAQAAQTAGLTYAQMQQLEALKAAAKNPGAAGMGMGVGVGMGLGQNLMGAAGVGSGSTGEDTATRLKKLKQLLDDGLINQAEFDAKKKEILSKV